MSAIVGMAESARPWRRAAVWLLFLGPFFFGSYAFSNWLASQQPQVNHIVFAWEHAIPFVPWTIIPYWVIDLMYALSLFVCASRQELDAHGKRLFSAQLVAVTCFILFPLQFTFERPETAGFSGWLFATLSGFDQPYNQAPSLHIALLVILWSLYPRHLPKILHWPFHILCALIGVSVLTTYQHHFIDIPTGALLGCLCVWWFPLRQKSLWQSTHISTEPRRWRIALHYLLGATVLAGLALYAGGVVLWLLWPALSLFLVFANYVYLGSHGFQKDNNGNMSIAAKMLFLPYLIGAKINSRLWTRRQPKAVAICDGVHLGRMPSRSDVKNSDYRAVLDMTAEFDRSSHSADWHSFPSLDLILPSKEILVQAAHTLIRLEKRGTVLVTCALGYSRSALAIMAWLLISKRVHSVDEAIAMVKQKRPTIVINEDAKTLLAGII